MTKRIYNSLKIVFIVLIVVFSFQVSAADVQSEISTQKVEECKKIKMGSVRFLGCWGDTSQVCIVKGDCADELKEILE